MKRLIYVILATGLFFTGCSGMKGQRNNTGWKPLFDGKDIKDWFVKIHHHEVGVNFGNTFRVEDGIIKIR